ncbi:MAG: glycosyltransferase family 10 domain-containing protein [Chloroflexota bacterium]
MAFGGKIRLKLVDFWHPPTREEMQRNWFYRFLSQYWEIELSDRPDFLLYSVMGLEHLKYNCTRIFYTGENDRPNFAECDYAFSFDFPITERNYRLPYYRLVNEYPLALQPRDPQRVLSEPRKFCSFISSNPGATQRSAFFEQLCAYKPVDSGGKVLNNLGYRVPDKNAWLSGYKFNIAFENASYPGYTTEKLLDALVTNTIPIYWGNPEIVEDFNPRAFINCHDYRSFDEVIEVVRQIDQDEALYREYLSQPFLQDGQEKDFCKAENIAAAFERIFSRPTAFVPPARKRMHNYLYYLVKGRRKLRYEIRRRLG